MNRIIVCFLNLLFSIPVFSQSRVPVFISGNEGHKSYRIPAIIGLPDGTLLAFCEGRVNDSHDFGNINIVMKQSKNKGKSWNPIQTIVDYGDLQAGNPAPVLDLLDPKYPKGRIFLFYNTGHQNENEVRKGKALREVWYKTSVDGGHTWSNNINITAQAHRPKQPQINPTYNFKEDWRGYANTPGHAMQISQGQYKGRIYIAANHSTGDPLPSFEDYIAHCLFTDDHGNTFQLSDDLPIRGSNESTAAELSGGRLMINSRNQKGDIRARIVGLSSNGGKTWDTVYFDMNLPDPVCEGSILHIGKHKGRHILAFSNAAHTSLRDNLTLRISSDDGKTWNKKITIDHDETKKSNSAYSDLIKINKNNIGVLYEKDNYSSIVFTVVNWRK